MKSLGQIISIITSIFTIISLVISCCKNHKTRKVINEHLGTEISCEIHLKIPDANQGEKEWKIEGTVSNLSDSPIHNILIHCEQDPSARNDDNMRIPKKYYKTDIIPTGKYTFLFDSNEKYDDLENCKICIFFLDKYGQIWKRLGNGKPCRLNKKEQERYQDLYEDENTRVIKMIHS